MTDFFIAPPPPHVFEWIGVAGFVLYVLNYTLLTLHVIESRHAAYFAINLAAASLVLISLTHTFNLASVLIQVFWIVISVVAITLRVTRLRRRPDVHTRMRALSPPARSKPRRLAGKAAHHI